MTSDFSPAEAQATLSDTNLIPVVQHLPLNPSPVDKGAIGAIQVDDHKSALLQIDACMPAGGAFIGQMNIVVARAADGGALRRQRVPTRANLQPRPSSRSHRYLEGQLDIA